jgi:competence ComEA-like helix-hairpin-helix protein
MNKAPLFSLVFAASALVASTLITAASQSQPVEPQPAASTADDPGAALFSRMCSPCHDAARIVEKRRTKDDWQDVILKMIEKGANGEEKDFESVFAYLCLNHGEVHINSATPDEIVMTLGLSRKDADAILAYRTAHGRFTDLEALKKVPDIDVKKLEAHKDALAF